MDDAKLGLHHYAVHSEKPFECSQCGEKGNGVQKFKNHMAKHAQKKSAEMWHVPIWNPSPGKSEEAYETSHNCNSERHIWELKWFKCGRKFEYWPIDLEVWRSISW